MRRIAIVLILCIFPGLTGLFGQMKMKRDTLNFAFEGKKLSGFINMPESHKPSAILILIPGHGKTNFQESNWYYDTLIHHFSKIGLACFRWDRAGCGISEGIYEHDQSVQSSAKEIIAAFEELKRRNIPGSKKIGLWGLSRGGYICPLVIQEFPSINGGGSIVYFTGQGKAISARWLDSLTLEVTHDKDIVFTRKEEMFYFCGDQGKVIYNSNDKNRTE